LITAFRNDSISSFLTCPESELEEELNFLTEDDMKCMDDSSGCFESHRSHNLSGLKYRLTKLPRESIYLRLLLVLALLLLVIHCILLYKLYKVDLNNYVNINQLKQLADLTSRVVEQNNYVKWLNSILIVK